MRICRLPRRRKDYPNESHPDGAPREKDSSNIKRLAYYLLNLRDSFANTAEQNSVTVYLLFLPSLLTSLTERPQKPSILKNPSQSPRTGSK